MTLPIGLKYSWDSSAWYGAIVTILLFLIGYILGFRQGDIQAEQHELQRALANLELQEKITCFDANSIALQNDPRLLEKAFNLAGDARSAVFLFSHADQEMQQRFLDGLDGALSFVPHPVTVARPAQREHLDHALTDLRRRLHDVIPADGLEEAARRVDARLAILTSSVDADELSRLRAEILVLIDWELFERDRWPMHIEAIDEIGHWFTPWYLGPDGRPSDWRDPDATPIPITEWRRAGGDHVTKIERIRQSNGHGPGPALTVLSWALPGGRRLVLDGNHRLAAAVYDGPQSASALASIVITGPLDERCLPDLRHWVARAPNSGGGEG